MPTMRRTVSEIRSRAEGEWPPQRGAVRGARTGVARGQLGVGPCVLGKRCPVPPLPLGKSGGCAWSLADPSPCAASGALADPFLAPDPRNWCPRPETQGLLYTAA